METDGAPALASHSPTLASMSCCCWAVSGAADAGRAQASVAAARVTPHIRMIRSPIRGRDYGRSDRVRQPFWRGQAPTRQHPGLDVGPVMAVRFQVEPDPAPGAHV